MREFQNPGPAEERAHSPRTVPVLGMARERDNQMSWFISVKPGE